MKAQVLFIVLMAGVLTSDAFAGNTNHDPKQQEAEKKTIKPKYDFNIFKFFSVPTQPVDSLKKEVSPIKKALLLTRKELTVLPEKKKLISAFPVVFLFFRKRLIHAEIFA